METATTDCEFGINEAITGVLVNGVTRFEWLEGGLSEPSALWHVAVTLVELPGARLVTSILTSAACAVKSEWLMTVYFFQ
jgi:hypothetical protein